ncbi:MAG: autotransporter domain-containing protein [Syntrophobacteraceae bacterium]
MKSLSLFRGAGVDGVDNQGGGFSLSIFCCLFGMFLFLSSPVLAHAYSSILSFGDSLSDDGGVSSNGQFGVQGIHPYSALPDLTVGPFTDGTTWVTDLSKNMNVPLLDIAYGGASSGLYNPWAIVNKYTQYDGTGLLSQVNTYLTNFDKKASGFTQNPQTTLVTVLAGANDFLFGSAGVPQPYAFGPVDAANNIKTAVTDLVNSGFTNFLVPGLPDIPDTPAFQNTKPSQQTMELAEGWMNAYNTQLFTDLTTLKAEYPTYNFYTLDTQDYIQHLEVQAYAQNGITGVDGLFWIDGLHPSATTHQLVANLAESIVSGASYQNLLVDKSLGNSPYTIASSLACDDEWIGVSSLGGIMNQAGYTNTVGDALNVGAQSGASGTYNLSGGALKANFEDVGEIGIGTFNQSGGTNTVTYGLTVGDNSGTGYYNLSAGTNTVNGGLFVGAFRGTGTFTQTGGNNSVTGGLYLGADVFGSGSTMGTYNLSGGALLADTEAVGLGGTGTFNHTNANNTVSGELFVGSEGGTGTYNLSGGALKADSEFVGLYGTGIFTQTGGTNTNTGMLFLGLDTSFPGLDTSGSGTSKGEYTLSGGTNTVESGMYVGDGGTGTFTQTGGNNIVNGGLIVGFQGGTGTYNLSGGVLRADSEFVGESGTGTFTQTGGTNTVNEGLYLGAEGGTATYNLSGGVLQLDPEGMGGAAAATFTQGTNGYLYIGMASAKNYGWLNMNGTGTANFNGGTIVPMLQGGFVPTQNQTFDVIQNALNITGTPTIGDFTATLVGSVVNNPSDPTKLTISASRDYTNSALTLTQNQEQVGNMLNNEKVSETITGDFGNVLHAIDSIPVSQAGSVAGVYQQMSPDVAASLGNLGFAAASFFQQDLNQRITTLRYADLAGLTSGVAGGQSPALAMQLGQASVLQGAGPSAIGQGNGWNFYADPQVSWGSQGSTAKETGYNFSIGGLTAGADYRVCDDLLIGAASGYAHTDAGFYNNMGNVQNDTVPINFYAAYFPGSFYAYGSAGYAVNLFNTNREMPFFDRTTTASPTGNMFNGYAEEGYDLRAGNFVLTPMASLAYSSLWIDGFGETGADSLDLNVDSQHAQSLQLGPGLRLASVIKCGRAVVAPQLYASYEHEFCNNSRNIDASLAQAGIPFGFQSQQLGTDFAMLGASITVFSGQSFSVRLDSNMETGRANYNACMVDAGLTFRF